MTNKIQGGVTITAIMDGVTLNGNIMVLNTPLIQRYPAEGGKPIPDFEALSETKKPVAVPYIVEAMSGKVLVPNQITFKYNGIPLTFGANNLCTTPSFEGVFKKVLSYPVPMGAGKESVNLPALQVVKNLVPISGYDNDMISMTGTVEINGQAIEFAEMRKTVIIEKTSGSDYDVVITDNCNGYLNDSTKTAILKANVTLNGVNVDNLAGYTFKWWKLNGDSGKDVQLSSSTNTQSINVNEIDYMISVRCDLYQNGVLKRSGYHQIVDNSDSYIVIWEFTDASGAPAPNQLRKGQTLNVRPRAKAKNGGTEKPITEYTFKTLDSKGKDFTLDGKAGPSFVLRPNQMPLNIPFAAVEKAGYALHIILNATL
ncbi:hypothetical protein EVA_18091 [gut metagenome]|uniref:Uncharacterized protein n=1 Tax=gut metagenome TaxID=749906 RepID=J9FFV3_9ZZZZ